jgi:hypothetical protein
MDGLPFPMNDKIARALAEQSRRDPVREYLDQQSSQAYGDAGANVGKGALSVGAGLGMGSPLAAALMALGFGGKAAADVARAGEFGGAADAFGQTGLPGAPMGQAMPMSEPDPRDPRVGRFANPMLMGGR